LSFFCTSFFLIFNQIQLFFLVTDDHDLEVISPKLCLSSWLIILISNMKSIKHLGLVFTRRFNAELRNLIGRKFNSRRISLVRTRVFLEWIRPQVRPTLDQHRARRALSKALLFFLCNPFHRGENRKILQKKRLKKRQKSCKTRRDSPRG
jgi:hypothetical protein